MAVATPPIEDASTPRAGGAEPVGGTTAIPVLAESATIGKEVVSAGALRVRIEVEHDHERVGGEFSAHEVQYRVRAVGAPAAERREPYRDGDEIVVPVYEERVVVERRLFLKEEVRLRRVARNERVEADVPLRRERAVVERRQPDGSWREAAIDAASARRADAAPGAPLAETMLASHPDGVADQGRPFSISRRQSMNQTLVAAFDSRESAERAAQELTRLGFDRDEIQIQTTRAAADRAETTSDDRSDDDTGILASIRHFFSELFGHDDEHAGHAGHYTEAVRRGGAVLTVVSDETRLDVARQALDASGAIDIDERAAAWRSEGWTGHDENAPAYSDEQAAGERAQQAAPRPQRAAAGGSDETVMPVVEEELKVGKRQVSGGAVRVVSRVVSRPVSESVELRREEAVVERRPVDREASPGDGDAFRERTIEVQEMAEQPVVQKSAHVVEEVVVGKRVSTDTQRVDDTVRRTEVNVERVGGAERDERGGGVAGAVGGARRDFADVEDEFRNDYQQRFARGESSYDELRPAYREGYDLRGDSRFAECDWDQAEPELRGRWEREHPESTWERVKDAVRHGWERATS